MGETIIANFMLIWYELLTIVRELIIFLFAFHLWYLKEMVYHSVRTCVSMSSWHFLTSFSYFSFSPSSPFYSLLLLILEFPSLVLIKFMTENCCLPSIFLFDLFNSESIYYLPCAQAPRSLSKEERASALRKQQGSFPLGSWGAERKAELDCEDQRRRQS